MGLCHLVDVVCIVLDSALERVELADLELAGVLVHVGEHGVADLGLVLVDEVEQREQLLAPPVEVAGDAGLKGGSQTGGLGGDGLGRVRDVVGGPGGGAGGLALAGEKEVLECETKFAKNADGDVEKNKVFGELKDEGKNSVDLTGLVEGEKNYAPRNAGKKGEFAWLHIFYFYLDCFLYISFWVCDCY